MIDMKNNITQGITLMVSATLLFAIMDGVSRYLAETYNVMVINMLRAWVLAFIVIVISFRKNKGISKVSRSGNYYLQIFRGTILISCVCIGVYSFTILGLVTSHVIISCYPLIVIAMSGPFLNEKIGWRRWLAVLIGFLGVITIINPISLDFDLNLLWPILLSILLAVYTIFTRKVSAYDNSETSFFWVAIMGCIIMSVVGPFYWEPIFFKDLGYLIFLCILSTCGHFLLIKALENAEASILQPFTYFQLLFASIIGIFLFNDKVNENILLGGFLIVGSGVFAAWRTHSKNSLNENV